jgi:hypothetical protein
MKYKLTVDVISELSTWLQETRAKLHKDFTNNGEHNEI